MTAQQFQRASKANVHALPPPKMTPAQKQEVVTGMTEGEKRLLKAEKSASYHKGLMHATIPALAVGVAITLFVTTAIFDPISKAAGQNVATGAAIAAQQGER